MKVHAKSHFFLFHHLTWIASWFSFGNPFSLSVIFIDLLHRSVRALTFASLRSMASVSKFICIESQLHWNSINVSQNRRLSEILFILWICIHFNRIHSIEGNIFRLKYSNAIPLLWAIPLVAIKNKWRNEDNNYPFALYGDSKWCNVWHSLSRSLPLSLNRFLFA